MKSAVDKGVKSVLRKGQVKITNSAAKSWSRFTYDEEQGNPWVTAEQRPICTASLATRYLRYNGVLGIVFHISLDLAAKQSDSAPS